MHMPNYCTAEIAHRTGCRPKSVSVIVTGSRKSRCRDSRWLLPRRFAAYRFRLQHLQVEWRDYRLPRWNCLPVCRNILHCRSYPSVHRKYIVIPGGRAGICEGEGISCLLTLVFRSDYRQRLRTVLHGEFHRSGSSLLRRADLPLRSQMIYHLRRQM